MNKLNRGAGLLLGLLLCLSQVQAGVGEGQELYDAYCQICHGGLGEGQAMGKPVTDSQASGLSDNELIGVISGGRSGTGMAAWGGSLSEQEIIDVASYIRVLQGGTGLALQEESGAASDDPAVSAGEALFNGQLGCVSCHSYDDRGGNIGPILDGIGNRLDAAELREALINPSASIASGYGAKTVITTEGGRITGRFRNDTELAVQIQSADGTRWNTYFKDRVQEVIDETTSLMPDVFADLPVRAQENLQAFLRSL